MRINHDLSYEPSFIAMIGHIKIQNPNNWTRIRHKMNTNNRSRKKNGRFPSIKKTKKQQKNRKSSKPGITKSVGKILGQTDTKTPANTHTHIHTTSISSVAVLVALCGKPSKDEWYRSSWILIFMIHSGMLCFVHSLLPQYASGTCVHSIYQFCIVNKANNKNKNQKDSHRMQTISFQ